MQSGPLADYMPYTGQSAGLLKGRGAVAVPNGYSRDVPMQTRVQKWGNSLGVRIPRGLAEQIGFGAGSEVSLSARDGELVVKPVRPTRLNLDDLLAGVTAENLHSSVDTGKAFGLEIF